MLIVVHIGVVVVREAAQFLVGGRSRLISSSMLAHHRRFLVVHWRCLVRRQVLLLLPSDMQGNVPAPWNRLPAIVEILVVSIIIVCTVVIACVIAAAIVAVSLVVAIHA